MWSYGAWWGHSQDFFTKTMPYIVSFFLKLFIEIHGKIQKWKWKGKAYRKFLIKIKIKLHGKIQCIYKCNVANVRVITNSKYNAHTDPIFINLHLLKLSDIRKIFELKFFFKLQAMCFQNFSTKTPLFKHMNKYTGKTQESQQITLFLLIDTFLQIKS